jgi:hypothetical protein
MNTPPSNPQTSPLRIQRLTLTDFRAFPGSAPAHFDFDASHRLDCPRAYGPRNDEYQCLNQNNPEMFLIGTMPTSKPEATKCNPRGETK